MANTVNESAIKKLKLLFTVVDRTKGEFYLDVLSQYEVNFQTLVNATGTAKSEILDMLGLNNSKAVIISVVREDNVEPIMKCLDDKFATIKNGKGIAFAVPLSSVIGVNIYQFLSNNKLGRED
jgi:nitrogen regulatory protein PII